MIYVDPPRLVPRDHPTAPGCFLGRRSAHLFADTTEELASYATEVLGMRREWIQHEGAPREHFDLVGRLLAQALRDPRVSKVSGREALELMARKVRAAAREKGKL